MGGLSVAVGCGVGDAYAHTSHKRPLAAPPPQCYQVAASSSSASSASSPSSPTPSVPPFPFMARCTSLPPLKERQSFALDKILELASKVTMKDARNALQKLKGEKPELFATPALYARAHALLSRYTLTLPVRRFVHLLFDRASFNDKNWAGLMN